MCCASRTDGEICPNNAGRDGSTGENMSQSPLPTGTPQVTPRYRRLLIVQTCLYCILVVAGAVYLFLQLFSVPGFWLPATRLILATTFVALAFVENSLRCEGVEPQDSEPVTETTAAAPRPPGRLFSRVCRPGCIIFTDIWQQHLSQPCWQSLLPSQISLTRSPSTSQVLPRWQ